MVKVKNQLSLDQWQQLKKVVIRSKAQEATIPDQIWQPLGIPCPIHNFRFTLERKWQIDYAWPDVKLAVEIEGGYWSRTIQCHRCGETVKQKDRNGKWIVFKFGGAHTGARYEKDIEKYNTLAFEGWSLLRFLPSKIDFKLIVDIYAAVLKRNTSTKTTV